MRLKDKVIIITGATAGIGRASAIMFAKEGAKIVGAGRSVAKGESLVEEIKSFGGEAIYVPTDMKKEEDLDALVKAAIDTYGRIDCLYNNAGIAYSAPLDVFDQGKWDEVLEVDLRAPYMLIKKAMPYLIESKGNILNTASISGVRQTALGYAYNSAKAGLVMLTKVLAADYAAQGVRVNAICPGITLTDILGTVADDVMEVLKASIPMKRLAVPDEIASAALFMCSDEASYMTGQAIAIDGGFTL